MTLSRHLQFLLIPTLMTFNQSEAAGGHTGRHSTENYRRSSTIVPQHHEPQKALPKDQAYSDNSFKNYILSGKYYFDKTDFVLNLTKRLSVQKKVFCFSRPRQCGKTLTMSLLKDFFNFHENFSSFANKTWNIMRDDEEHKKLRDVFMNKWPVIFISFIDSDGASTYEDLQISIRKTFYAAYSEFEYLRNSSELGNLDKKEFIRFVDEKPPELGDFSALHFLCKLLKIHHRQDPIIILDEADSPLAAATTLGFYSMTAGWMFQLLKAALKKSDNYKMAIISSVTPFNRYLTNMPYETHTISDSEFESSFGFVRPEVEKILDDPKRLEEPERTKLLSNISKWYNNFKIGNAAIYNPNSIVQCRLAHWEIKQTSDLQSSLQHITSCIFEKCGLLPLVSFDILLTIGELEVRVNPEFHFKDLLQRPARMWNHLYQCGIITLSAKSSAENEETVKVKITDEEIKSMMKTYIRDEVYSKELFNYSNFTAFVEKGDCTAVEKVLKRYIQKYEEYPSAYSSASEHDLADFVELIIRKFKPTDPKLEKDHKVVVSENNVEVYFQIDGELKKFSIRRKSSNTTSWGTAIKNAFTKDKIIELGKNKVVQISALISAAGIGLDHFLHVHHWWPF